MMVAEARAHREADCLRQSFGYGKMTDAGFKGCAVGCTIHSLNIRLGKNIPFDSHKSYEPELGIPWMLAKLQDGIYEGLPVAESLVWPEQFLAAIPDGAELSQVVDKFLHWLLMDEKDGVIRFAKTGRTRKAVRDVGELYRRKIAGENLTMDEWKKVSAGAYAFDAFAFDAFDAFAAFAFDAFAAFAFDAFAAYAFAAFAFDAFAAYAFAAFAARQNARKRQAEKLIELLESAPVPVAIQA